MTLPLLVGTTVLLAGAGYWLVRGRLPRVESFHVFPCPRCGQKLRYPKDTVSQTGMCPRCGRSCTLPIAERWRYSSRVEAV